MPRRNSIKWRVNAIWLNCDTSGRSLAGSLAREPVCVRGCVGGNKVNGMDTYRRSTIPFFQVQRACWGIGYSTRAYWNASAATRECRLPWAHCQHRAGRAAVLLSYHLSAIRPATPSHPHRNLFRSSFLGVSVRVCDVRAFELINETRVYVICVNKMRP